MVVIFIAVALVLTGVSTAFPATDEAEPAATEQYTLPEPGVCGVNLADRILGGNKTAINAYPWAALLVVEPRSGGSESFRCGGSLISDRFVLTAAHCFRELPDWAHVVRVRLGEWDLKSEQDCNDDNLCTDKPVDVDLGSYVVHEDYDSKNHHNDVALIKLAKPVTFTEFISPVCLPLTEALQNQAVKGKQFTVIGWGTTERGQEAPGVYGSRYKLEVDVLGADSESCREKYPKLEDSELCAGTYEVPVKLTEIFDFAAGGSRLVQEGERVFNAGHLLIVGAEQVHEDGVSIFSTCLQSSSPNSEPHVINIRTKESFPQWTFACTCKAGRGKCKHQMAVLYHLLKNPIVPLLTVTDLKQKWGKIAAKTATDMYKAMRLKDLCFSMKSTEDTSMEDSLNGSTLEESFGGRKTATSSRYRQYTATEMEQTQILQHFVKCFPASALGYEICGRPSIQAEVSKHSNELVNSILELNHSTSKLSLDSSCSIISFEDFSSESVVRRYVEQLYFSEFDLKYKYFVGPLEANLSTFYEIKICVSAKEATDICMRTISQNSDEWKEERSLRITASNAYSLFTYYVTEMDKSKDWKRKVVKLIFPENLKTAAIDHGRRCEKKSS